MPNPLRKRINQYLFFIKKDRNAWVILSLLILLIIIADYIVRSNEPKSKYDYSEFSKVMEAWEQNNPEDYVKNLSLFVFNPNTIFGQRLDSLNLSTFIKQNILSYRNAGGQFSEPADVRKIYGMNDSIFAELEPYIDIPPEIVQHETPVIIEEAKVDYQGLFDPNSADLKTLTEFGFTKFQAENLIKYRDNGGSFQIKSDLLKIYGVDSLFLAGIENNIRFEPRPEKKPENPEPLLLIELNRADTTELMKLAGIGSVFANRILKYRELLGGYFSKSQLMEVYNFPEETFRKIEHNITVDTISITKIRLNYADYSELIKHPYLDNIKVNAILRYREKNGSFTSTEQLKSIPEVDEITLNRIKPYFTCR